MFKFTSTIMLVDDEKDFVEVLSLRLKENGENVIAAYNGTECLENLDKNQQIDVIILDVKMPGMDGIETLKEIKNKAPLVEVIMLTGHGTIQTAIEGMKLGAFDFMLKPADFDALNEKLNSARQRRKEQLERIRRAETDSMLQQSRI
ncbi:MAG: response regulator [Desulfamplus sp.]|nr:response regulator [Desulfamplus sp.]